MRDGVRVSVEADQEAETVRVHGEDGEVSAGGATFSFSVTGSGTAADETEPPAVQDADAEHDVDPRYLGSLAEIPVNSTLRCEALNGDRGVEIILRRDAEEVAAWRNSCPHEPDVRLDRGDGAIVDDDELVCHKHGARFECGDSVCTYGPCQGDVLDEIEIEVQDGDVYLADDRFEAARRLDG